MFIKVLDPNNEVKYHIEASYIKWAKNTDSYCISVYPMITKGKQVGVLSSSESEVSNMPSVYIHVNHGDTVFVMNSDGKTIDKKKINLSEHEWVCPKCSHRNLPSEKTCPGRHTIRGTCGYDRPKETK